MDASSHLDYVLFQLTPTRTRCDLVIFAGKSNEKLAYGLLEPFISHLGSAKDQISKGGYSITLRPSSSFAPWFAKATLQRFVKFVSTPEVLERFVTIEKEITQLDNSIKSYEASLANGGHGTEIEGNSLSVSGNALIAAASFKLKVESNDNSDSVQEENSKVRLQHVVETRKAVLRKEQAMVYARALAAGFEIDNLDDLIMFSDSFGATRMREACINFKELCKKKNEDRLWMDEIAAMQAIVQPDLSYLGTSGIILAEDNDPNQNFVMGGKQNGGTDVSISDSVTSHGSSEANQDNSSTLLADAKGQIPNPWANQFSPYLMNPQGPVYQQMFPYQGYVFPGMQVPPPYYPQNMQWHPTSDPVPHDRRDHKKSSRKKNKGSNLKENEGADESTGASGSSSESETDSPLERSRRKKNGKNSSRKVVIRNINYITPKREGENNGVSEIDSSDGDDYLNSSSQLQRKRNGSKHLGSADKGKKGNDNWNAFQQLLMNEEPDSNGPEPRSVQVEDEKIEEKPHRKPDASDAFIVAEKGGTGYHGSAAKLSVENFDPREHYQPAVKRRGTPEEFLFSQRTDEPEYYTQVKPSDDTARSSVIKSHTSDDWFIGKQSNEAANQVGKSNLRLIDGDYVASSAGRVEKNRKDVVFDDSVMIQGRPTDDLPESQTTFNVSLVSDIVEASLVENDMAEVPQKKSESMCFHEPDDLYMVLDRGTVLDQAVPSWSPEMDYENSVSVNDPVKSHTDAVVNADSKLTGSVKGPNNKKNGAPVTKASGKDASSRANGGPLRKGKPDTTSANRRSTFGSKIAPKSQPVKEEDRRKRMEELVIQRQKRIAEKSAMGGGRVLPSRKPQAGKKALSPSLCYEKPTLQSPTEATKRNKPILRSSTIERLAIAKTAATTPTPPKKAVAKMRSGSQKVTSTDTNKVTTNKTASGKKAGDENIKVNNSSVSHVESKVAEKIDASVPYRELQSLQGLQTCEVADDSKDIKELHITSSIVSHDEKVVLPMDTFDEKSGSVVEDYPAKLDSIRDNKDDASKHSLPPLEETKFSEGHGKSGSELSFLPLPESPTKPVGSTLIAEVKGPTRVTFQGLAEISEVGDSTPPTKEMGQDPIQSRKKWDSAENSPKAAKGFRKLLMFGRRT